jgi:hypothetical protein
LQYSGDPDVQLAAIDLAKDKLIALYALQRSLC